MQHLKSETKRSERARSNSSGPQIRRRKRAKSLTYLAQRRKADKPLPSLEPKEQILNNTHTHTQSPPSHPPAGSPPPVGPWVSPPSPEVRPHSWPARYRSARRGRAVQAQVPAPSPHPRPAPPPAAATAASPRGRPPCPPSPPGRRCSCRLLEPNGLCD